MRRWILVAGVAAVAGCASPMFTGDTASGAAKSDPVFAAGVGVDPVLDALARPRHPGRPPETVGWGPGEMPSAGSGLAVSAFAQGLEQPRWLYVLPNGDVLVAESAAPAGGDTPTPSRGGLRSWFGANEAATEPPPPSPDRITLLRDRDGDGRAEVRRVFIASGLHSPFGMARVGNRFFVANADAIVEYAYREDELQARGDGRRLAALPASRNGLWGRSLLASADGRTLYVGVGANSDFGERGLGEERNRAAILAVDTTTGAARPFATGLRGPAGLAWQPGNGTLWAVARDREDHGDHLVPDYLTSVREGDFFGWPWSWYGDRVDERVRPARPDLVSAARRPDYGLGPHAAPLGLAFYDHDRLGARFRGGVFIGEHGSPAAGTGAGHRVSFVPFADGRPAGPPEPVLSGFVDGEGRVRGRPAGVAVAGDGTLLVADVAGGTVWRVSPSARR